jgi:hypothetical protein
MLRVAATAGQRRGGEAGPDGAIGAVEDGVVAAQLVADVGRRLKGVELERELLWLDVGVQAR